MKQLIIASLVMLMTVPAVAAFDFNFDVDAVLEQAKKEQAVRDSLDYRITTGDVYRQTSSQIEELRKKVSSGVAGVAAMNNVPVVPGKELSVGAAFGSFDSETALAVGANFTPSNAPVAFKATVAATPEEAVYGAGFAVGF
ncbi:hypothetical protein BI049_gp256 [Salmonella phage vB_SnwM_CGG4-1]|uniref:Trimeric autotransporter adhesin YadA-like C-terminal membrane anchor domain-containing protein n=1 Tax=Salmonella phage vB_SnwM_CGG4-1 TaxID=1815631 RepID=A0A1B0VV73_9CAUD|nr:hypothetical protein BI049_gp256 [Salmonella phage vB_SnwM_CGG4-1]ANA49477.1 hypothetical protein CGG41_122 [Salmonella phage vB_SnwM_CGG4-1]